MIGKNISRLCCEDISLIENYEVAVNSEVKYDVHHRLELHPDGTTRYSMKSLIKLGLYYNRPASELIFMTHSEHCRIHNLGRSKGPMPEHQKKHLSEHQKGLWKDKKWSDNQRKLIKEANANYWGDKPEKEYVLGRRIQQKFEGVRDEEGYRAYQFSYQQKFRQEHPFYYKYLQQYKKDKKNGEFAGTFKEWCAKKGVTP